MVDVGSDVGGYRLVRYLGEGGFGVVFLGEHRDGHRGAVKVLHLRHTGDADFRERFAREVALARQVSSFCTARVLDADPGAPRPWIATEYVDGPTLASVVLNEGPRSGGELYRLAVSTATALAAIHAVGVVHRDFKPENILLGRDGARVIDFGVSRALEGGRMSASTTIGTPRYMAPEQLQGLAVTPALDVFAWGAVIAFAATGRDCFDGPNQGAVLLRVLMEEPDVAGVPGSLRPLLLRCMDKDPLRRPTGKEVLASLLGYTEEDDDPLAAGERVATGRAAPPSGFEAAASAGPARPFRFAGREYTSAEDVARALQDDWPQAVDLLESAPHRHALIRWLPPGSPAREVLREAPGPGGGALAVARLIARLAPGIPPRYMGADLTMEALVDGRGNPAPVLVENEELRTLVEGGLLEVLAEHHCRTPAEHDCPAGAACVRYARFARNLKPLLSAAVRYRRWSREISHLVRDGRLRYEPEFARLFAAAHRALDEEPDTDPERLAELAEGGLDAPPGGRPVRAALTGDFATEIARVRRSLRRSVYAAAPGERWGLAVCLRGLGPVLREAVVLRIDLERFAEQGRREQDERRRRLEELTARPKASRFALIGPNAFSDRAGVLWLLSALVSAACSVLLLANERTGPGVLLMLLAGASVAVSLTKVNLGGTRGPGADGADRLTTPEPVRGFRGNAARAGEAAARLREHLAALAPPDETPPDGTGPEAVGAGTEGGAEEPRALPAADTSPGRVLGGNDAAGRARGAEPPGPSEPEPRAGREAAG